MLENVITFCCFFAMSDCVMTSSSNNTFQLPGCGPRQLQDPAFFVVLLPLLPPFWVFHPLWSLNNAEHCLSQHDLKSFNFVQYCQLHCTVRGSSRKHHCPPPCVLYYAYLSIWCISAMLSDSQHCLVLIICSTFLASIKNVSIAVNSAFTSSVEMNSMFSLVPTRHSPWKHKNSTLQFLYLHNYVFNQSSEGTSQLWAYVSKWPRLHIFGTREACLIL